MEATHTESRWRSLGYAALVPLTAAGLWAIVVRFSEGLMVTRMTQHVPWGLWIALYIYFIGLSAGSFLLSTLVYVFRIKRFEEVGPLALIQAIGCLALGMFLVAVDLGHPERFLNVFIHWNWQSILAWECLFYTAYAAIILAELYLALRPALARRAQSGTRLRGLYRLLARGDTVPDSAWMERAGKRLFRLGLLGIPVAVGVHGGTGAIFAVVKSRPSWYTGLFPIVFLVSALASGGALLTFLTATVLPVDREHKLPLVQSLARLTVGIVGLDLLLILSEMLVTFYGGIPDHVFALRETLFGPYWWVFWFVQIGLGAVLPIAIVAHPRAGRSVRWLGAAGLLVVLGVIGVRLNIVIPPLIRPQFAALPDAYHHQRFALGYFPSANEWLVGLGAVCLGIWAFLAAFRILPLQGAHAAEPGDPDAARRPVTQPTTDVPVAR